MKLETDFFGIIAMFAIFHSILIGIFLMFQVNKRGISALFLGLTQMSGAMVLSSSLVTTTNMFSLFPQLIGIPYPFIFISGFFTLFYVYSLMEDVRTSVKQLCWLFIGLGAGIALSVPFFIKDSAARAEYLLFIRQNHNFPDYDWVVWLTGLAFNWFLLAMALLKIRSYRRSLMKEHSNTEGIDLSLMSREIWLLFICWIVIALLCAFSINRWMVEVTLKASAMFPAVYLIVIGYSYLLNLFPSSPVRHDPNPLKGKIPQKQLTDMYVVIKQEMEQNKHHLNPELTLPLLAEKTSFYRNELSEVINSQSGSSFYHFVNSYRIEHFKKLLMQDRNANILDLAFASGFNSKGAFYNAFKRITGITPRQYLASVAG